MKIPTSKISFTKQVYEIHQTPKEQKKKQIN